MPSSTTQLKDEFFTMEHLRRISTAIGTPIPIVKGKVWTGEERNHGWTIECETFNDFALALSGMGQGVQFLAFDESYLDEDALSVVQDELYRYAEEEGMNKELVQKAVSALRSHEGELFAVFAYAFLQSGQVLFVRAQSELARFVFHPDRLLSNDGLLSVRKLRTLVEN